MSSDHLILHNELEDLMKMQLYDRDLWEARG